MLFGLFGSSSDNNNEDGTPTRLPSYFPVQPKGCESVSESLFSCVTDTATAKARDLEKANLHTSYYDRNKSAPPSTETSPPPQQQQPTKAPIVVVSSSSGPSSASDHNTVLPQAGENPLDECKKQIQLYQKCCQRELKKRKNWILTEPYRVQEEYRYNNNEKETTTSD